MGEATSDFFVFKFNRYLAVFSGFIVFLIAIIIQLKAKKYNPWIYWFAVTMVAVFGTMAADSLHLQLHVPYIASTILFALALAAVFIIWHRIEKTLSIHSINTSRREVFYWLAVLATFALGTAAGDLTATTVGLGYFASGLLFSGLFFIPGIIYWLTKKHQVLWFWSSYVLTRPLGASFADWASKSKQVGSLNYGDGRVAIVLSIVIIIFVAYLAIGKVDVKSE